MGDKKYKAFISYSHADEAWGGRLQGWLERFRAPRALAEALEAQGKAARLSPVFRDREDLPVAGSLNSAIQAALADSEFQIVLCSPNSAKSRWVNEEIKLFHKLHGPGRVFALIVGGEPNATRTPGREDDECFPPALRFELDQNGDLTGAPAETLAADAREDGDGKRYALLKVAAGMLGVGLDDLIRRDAARRARQAWTITSASLTAAAATLALAVFAIAKSNEATLMRGKAENLIEFMLTDLKDKLEPVGRLDVLESVGDRAMAYYADQDPKSLDDDALARRAKAMMQLGTIDFRRNNLDAAQNAYEAAEAATAELLRRSPNNPDRIFDHAQAVFYVGEAAGAKGDSEKSEKQFNDYLRHAETLVSIDGENPKWQLELAYATSNLGALKFNAGDYDAADPYFETSINARRGLRDAASGERKVAYAYAYALSWRAYNDLTRGACRKAIDLLREQLEIYGPDAGPLSQDYQVLGNAVTARRRLVEASICLGDLQSARDELSAALESSRRLVERDEENVTAILDASFIEQSQSLLLTFAGDEAGAAAAAVRAVGHVQSLREKDINDRRVPDAEGFALARRVVARGDPGERAAAARELEKILTARINSAEKANLSLVAAGALALARYRREEGDAEGGRKLAHQAIDYLRPKAPTLAFAARVALAGLYSEAGDAESARLTAAALIGAGVRHPELQAGDQASSPLAGQ